MFITIKGNRANREIKHVYYDDYRDVRSASVRKELRRNGFGQKEHLRAMPGELIGWSRFENSFLLRIGNESIIKSNGTIRCKGRSKHYIKSGEDAICVANGMHFCKRCIVEVRTPLDVITKYGNTDNYSELEVTVGSGKMPFDQWVKSVSR